MTNKQLFDKIDQLFGNISLQVFCKNHFPTVYDNFGESNKQSKILALVDHCDRTLQTDRLIQLVKRYSLESRLFYMIDDAFNSDALNTFCFNVFTLVYNNFTEGQKKTQRITELLNYCFENDLVEQLIQQLKVHRKVMFRNHFPNGVDTLIQEEKKELLNIDWYIELKNNKILRNKILAVIQDLISEE